MNENEIKRNIEALLFAWGDKIELEELSKLLGIDLVELNEVLDTMITDDFGEHRGIQIYRFNNSVQLATKSECYEILKRLSEIKFPKLLSNAALEVLSVVAYRQPVTKLDIDQIRGVKSDRVISSLLEKGLICENGYLDKIGKPHLYVTTDEFLKSFGFHSLSELPPLSSAIEDDLEEMLKNMEAEQ